MKQYLILLPLLHLILTTRSQDMQDLRHAGFPGQVINPASLLARNRIEKETVYEYDGSKRKADSAKIEETTYDARGNPLVRKNFDGNKPTSKESYEYAAGGKLHRVLIEFYSPPDFLIHEFTYDSAGNEIREYRYNKDTTIVTADAKAYNGRNQLMGLYRKEFRDTFRLKEKYSYNEKSILDGISLYDRQGVAATYTFFLDSGGRYSKVIYQDRQDDKKKKEYIYNDVGECIRLNGFALQPVVTVDDGQGYSHKTELKVIPQTVFFDYNSDGTLLQVTEKIDKKIKTVKRHYYSMR